MRLVSVQFYEGEYEAWKDTYRLITQKPELTEWIMKNCKTTGYTYHSQRYCTVEAAREDYGRKVLSKDAR